MDGKSLNLLENKIAQLKELFPEVFSEGKINWESLKNMLGENISYAEERYHLTWAGKSDCYKIIQETTPDTLIPCKDESIKWDDTENIFIEGENLKVLKILQKSYYGKIKMIYIDPPYNTGSDSFIYPDKFAETKEEYMQRAGEMDEEGYVIQEGLFRKNSKESGRFHSNWLSMMYPRLFLAKNLLRDDGVIFISIGEEEVASLKLLMNEIFGEDNFRNTFILRRYDKNLNRQFIENGLSTFNVGYEYVVCYSKSNLFKFFPIFRESSEERSNFGYWKGFWNDANRPTMRYELLGFEPTKGQWKWSKDRSSKAVENYQRYKDEYAEKMTLEEYWTETGKQLEFIRRNPEGRGRNKGVENWIAPSTGILRNTNWTDILASKNENDLFFDFPKNVSAISNLIICATEETDIVLDFFAGSCTTAQAILDLNKINGSDRRFIMIQMPENTPLESEAYNAGFKTIAQIGIDRIQKSIIKMEKETEKNSKLFDDNYMDLGFKVFKHSHSNFKQWRANKITNEDELLKELDLFVEMKHDNAIKENIIYEIMIKSGCSLNDKVEAKEHNNKLFYIVSEKSNSDESKSSIYLLDEFDEAFLNSIVEEKSKTVFVLDNLFKDNDRLKTNVALQLKERSKQLITI